MLIKEFVWAVADMFAIFLVAMVDIEMKIAPPSMISGIEVCELCQEWSWILGQRMEESKVDDFGGDCLQGHMCQGLWYLESEYFSNSLLSIHQLLVQRAMSSP